IVSPESGIDREGGSPRGMAPAPRVAAGPGRACAVMVLCRVVRFRLVALLALLAFLGTAEAQYFGRDKVLWERFDFVVRETEHVLVHYYRAGAPHGEYAARLAERWYARLSRFFDHEFEEKKPLIIYANHA